MSRKVLIFEDDIACHNILQIVSNDCGYETFAFSMWKSESIEDIIQIKPDIIFLDEWFHQMKGIEICMILRSINQLKEAQIYIISDIIGIESIPKECKANGYITKPFSLFEIEQFLS